ncbi:MAG: serine protease [Opitutaceae bacterium]|mgnify:CR=1 FL=1|jgi:membrane-bound ClpP family serine protease|nr:serine protease [Opitutaceae bacterium]
MTVVATLFVVGVLLLGFEVLLPGGILGIFAGLCLLGGTGFAFVEFGMSGGLIALMVAVVLVAAVLYFELAILPKTAMGKRLFLKKAIDGKSSPKRDRDYVGAEGVTLTALGPTGYIEIDGKRLEAFSRSGFLETNVPVKVVGTDNFRLIVTPAP